jgi:predicted Zn-dependent peptidase
VAAHDLNFGMEWLHEILFKPTLLPEKLEKERHVIINEKGGDLDRLRKVWEWLEDHNLGWSVARAIRRRLYPDSPLLLPIIGTDQSLKSITHEMLVNYHHQFYVPDLMTLLVVGDVSPENVLELAEKTFGQHPSSTPPPTHPPSQIVPDPFHITLRGPTPNEQGQFFSGALLDSSRHPDRFAWWVICEMLDNVYLHEIRYQRGLSYGVNVFPVMYTDTGYLVIHTSANVGEFDLIRAIVEKHLQRLIAGDFSETELREAKTALKGRALLSIQDNLECAWWVCSDILAVPSDAMPMPDYFWEIERLTYADILRVANAYLAPQKRFSIEHRPSLTPRRLGRLALWATIGIIGSRLFFPLYKK